MVASVPRMRSIRNALFGLLGLVLVVVSLVGLAQARSGGSARSADVSGVPVTVYSTSDSAPTVVIAHGFAGSAQIMDPLARALMHSGFTVVTYDTDGHGHNPLPLAIENSPRWVSADALQTTLGKVVDWTRNQPEVDPARLALLGHSMGAGAVVRYAVDNPESDLAAIVAISLPSATDIPVGQPAGPPNLLLLVGSLESTSFTSAAANGLQAGYPQGAVGQTYGDFADRTARSAMTIQGAEHIGIVFNQATADASAEWISSALGVGLNPSPVSPVLLWVILALVGAGLLLVPVARYTLGTADESETSPRMTGWRVLAVSAGASVVASLVAKAATPVLGIVPISVGGYVIVWFLSAGLTLIGWWYLRNRGSRPTFTRRSVLGAVIITMIAVLALAIPGSMAWAPFALVGSRAAVLPVLLVAFGCYFAGDELIGRRSGFGARLGLIIGSRLIAVAVILASVSLLQAPGFLMLLLPLMLLLFGVLGWYAAIVGRYRNGYLAAVLVQAVPLSILVATTFPLVNAG